VYLTEYVSSEKITNAKPMEYGLVGGLNFSCAMLLAPLVTYLASRFRLQVVVLSGCFLQGIGYVAASFASRTWHLYLTQGALVGSGIGFIIIPSMAVLSQWFSKRRSIANGISSAGSGVGGAAFTWGTAAMIQHQGLGWALRTTGLITLAATVPATLLLRDRNSQIQPNQRAVDIALLRSKAVVFLLMWAFISMFGYIVLLFSLSEFALAIGLSHKQATDVIGFLNVGTAVGRPLIGLASDRFSSVATACVLTLLCGLTCFALWLPSKSFGLTLCFSILCGAILGVFWMVSISLFVQPHSEHLERRASLTFHRLLAPCRQKSRVSEIFNRCSPSLGLQQSSLLQVSNKLCDCDANIMQTIDLDFLAAEVIALLLQDLPGPRTYLYPQIFAGISYIIASGFLAALWRNLRKRNSASLIRRPSVDVSSVELRENYRRSLAA
jgi:cyanate permease